MQSYGDLCSIQQIAALNCSMVWSEGISVGRAFQYVIFLGK
jgi:hypothetical protein